MRRRHMVLPFIACYCVCYIRNCLVFGNIVFFCALSFRVFTSVVWFRMYGVSVTRYWEVMCEEGRRHTDLRRSVKVPASSACNLHEENQLFENKLNDVPASCSFVSKGLYLELPSAGSRSLEDAKLTQNLMCSSLHQR